MPDHLPVVPEEVTAEPVVARTSVQKVHELLAQVQTQGLGEAGLGAMQALAVEMVLPHAIGMVPTDPVELDALLDRAVEFVGSLRSDPGAA